MQSSSSSIVAKKGQTVCAARICSIDRTASNGGRVAFGVAAVGGLSRDATKRGGMPAGLRARARPLLCGKTRKRARHAGTRRAIDGGCRGVPFASRGGETRARSGGRTFGRNWLKPRMRSLCPLKIVLTRLMTPSVSILFRRGERGRGSAKGTRIGHPMMWKTGSGAARAVASAARRRSRRIDRHPSAVARDQKGRKALPRAPLSFELLHDLEELIVRVLLVLQTLLELTKIRERLLLAQRVVRRCLLHRGCGHALHRITPPAGRRA